MRDFNFDIRNGILRKYGGFFPDVVIPEHVTGIGSNAFLNCRHLESVQFPKGLTAIGDSAFFGCRNLERVLLPEGLEVIGQEAFGQCTNLKEVHLPDSLLELKNNAFNYCTELRKIVIPKNIKKIRKLTFYYCSGLEELILPEGLLAIEEQALYRCSSLKEIRLPDSIDYVNEAAVDYQNQHEFIYKNIRFSNLEQTGLSRTRRYINPYYCIDIIKNHEFDREICSSEKMRILIQMHQQNPALIPLNRWLRGKNFAELMRGLIYSNAVSTVKDSLQAGIVPKEHIDYLIRYAIENEKPEIQVMLVNYKREKFGFESIADKAKGMRL